MEAWPGGGGGCGRTRLGWDGGRGGVGVGRCMVPKKKIEVTGKILVSGPCWFGNISENLRLAAFVHMVSSTCYLV
jgi:hypothetical protein